MALVGLLLLLNTIWTLGLLSMLVNYVPKYVRLAKKAKEKDT